MAIRVGVPFIFGKLVGQNRKVDERIALEFPREIKAVFIQLPATGGKGGYKADFHDPFVSAPGLNFF